MNPNFLRVNILFRIPISQSQHLYECMEGWVWSSGTPFVAYPRSKSQCQISFLISPLWLGWFHKIWADIFATDLFFFSCPVPLVTSMHLQNGAAYERETDCKASWTTGDWTADPGLMSSILKPGQPESQPVSESFCSRGQAHVLVSSRPIKTHIPTEQSGSCQEQDLHPSIGPQWPSVSHCLALDFRITNNLSFRHAAFTLQ